MDVASRLGLLAIRARSGEVCLNTENLIYSVYYYIGKYFCWVLDMSWYWLVNDEDFDGYFTLGIESLIG